MDCVLTGRHIWVFVSKARTLFGRRILLECRDCGEYKIVDTHYPQPENVR